VTDARPARLAALRARLLAREVDALLVSALPNVRYLTGFSGSHALLVVSARDVVLLTDVRYATQAEAEAGAVARVEIEPVSLWTRLWRVLPALAGVTRVGFESAHLAHRDAQRVLDQGARWTWWPLVDEVEALRERKDAGEVAAIRAAGALAGRALARALAEVRVGLSETAVAGILERALRDEGSEGFPFPTIVASGPQSALPHARPSRRVLARGDLLLLDFGAVVDGYVSDVTRTVVLGAASPEQAELHAVVREAQARARTGVRAGMSGRDADALARRYIDDRGWGEAFGHSLGHGIGLEVHEGPRLSRAAEAALPPGAVVTIEPGVYRPGWGGVRIEDDVWLGPDGPDPLTDFPRDLLEVG
jgi:Xaa-Pro aminopeptidase